MLSAGLVVLHHVTLHKDPYEWAGETVHGENRDVGIMTPEELGQGLFRLHASYFGDHGVCEIPGVLKVSLIRMRRCTLGLQGPGFMFHFCHQ